MLGLSRFWAGLVARGNAHRLGEEWLVTIPLETKYLKFQMLILNLLSEPNIWEIDNITSYFG